jgi:UDP-N-acetylglucosamine 4,6-dehydratase
VWVENKGGRWERMNGRPGERLDEYLVGDLELPYAREVTWGGDRHIVISFNEKSESPLPAVISSANAERLTHDEMVRLINHPED